MKRVGILLATALFALSAGAFAQSSWQTTGNTNTDGILGTKSGYNHPIKIVTNGIPRMYIANGGADEHSGYIGINTTTPRQRLHIVNGNILVTRTSAKDIDAPGSTNGSILFGDQSTTTHPYGRWGIEYLNQDGAQGLNFWKTWDENGGVLNYVLFLCEKEPYKGNVGIGTKNPTKKLSVNGSVLAKEVIVSNESTYWPDYVFSSDYELMSLGDLEAFVQANSHLPGVPSAAEVEEEGIKLGEMNTVLLQKVEELTRYVIDLQKQIDELKQGKE